MNKQLLVLGCSQTKREAPGKLPAIDRYDGSPYRVLRNFLRQQSWPEALSVGILSAKYGLMGGLTSIENYDLRMTPSRAQELSPTAVGTLTDWATSHDNVYFSLGKDYLPAVDRILERSSYKKTEVFEGPIGAKLHQIKTLLESTNTSPRKKPDLTQVGLENLSYFLPDWDDLLDPDFDFEKDEFSAQKRSERGDIHCSRLIKPKRISDGILVSLAQHVTSKGPLRRILGTEANSLAPKNLRRLFALEDDQFLFGDCGAFSYVKENEPAISVDQAVSLYELHGFDFGASVDHIPVSNFRKDGVHIELSNEERAYRVRITQQNAAEFIELAKKRQCTFEPVGIIQGLTAEEYSKMALLYHEMGYKYIALGGLVSQSDKEIEKIVSSVMSGLAVLSNRPKVHLFGVYRPKLQEKFKELGVDSFDSATYFRKAWLRSDQNYLSSEGKWYAAIRVPMTADGRTKKNLAKSGLDINQLELLEQQALKILQEYQRTEATISEVLDTVLEYDNHLKRSSDSKALRRKYRRTLEDRPWESCECPFCKKLGIHVLIFRGSNRNKRRGAHNTLMLYEEIQRET